MAAPAANWSDIPGDLLNRILQSECLNTSFDVSRVRSVCRSWRISVPPVSKSNLFLFQNSTTRFTLIENTIWSLRRSEGTSGGELVHGYETEGGIRALSHPIFQSCDHHDVDTYSRSRSLFDGRLQEQAKFYVVLEQRFLPGDDSDRPTYTESSMKALVLPTSGTGRAVLWLRAASTYDLRLWKTGDVTWTAIRGISPFSVFEDITIFDGQFVALHKDGALSSINPSTRTAELLCPWKLNHSSPPSRDPRRLVVSRSTLYVVETGFKVYMLVKNIWNQLIDLGGRALLWGHRCSFMVEESDLCGQFRPNRMYRHSGFKCSNCNDYYPLNPSGSRPPVDYNTDDISELDLDQVIRLTLSGRSGQTLIHVIRIGGFRPRKCSSRCLRESMLSDFIHVDSAN